MRNIIHILLIASTILLVNCCGKEKITADSTSTRTTIKACDLSFLPQVRLSGIVTRNQNNTTEDMLSTLVYAGINTVRLRLWYNPVDGHSGFEEVQQLSTELKAKGIKVWLSVHYSDTWADPAHQTKPSLWQSLSFPQLSDSVYQYTARIITELNPDYIQLGNETNNGLLWPEGKTNTNAVQMIQLLNRASKAVRDHSTKTKIMIHGAGAEESEAFFELVNTVDYDILAVSYYPMFHEKNFTKLKTSFDYLGTHFNKDVVIAETAYPFTLGWNDQTTNILGDTSQILSAFPPTPSGQLAFLMAIQQMVLSSSRGIGICYWGGEWISFKGATSTYGSAWENQAFWDFNNTALPAISAFKE